MARISKDKYGDKRKIEDSGFIGGTVSGKGGKSTFKPRQSAKARRTQRRAIKVKRIAR